MTLYERGIIPLLFHRRKLTRGSDQGTGNSIQEALYLRFRLESRFVESANISRVRGANFVVKTGPFDAANEFLSS